MQCQIKGGGLGGGGFPLNISGSQREFLKNFIMTSTTCA